MQSITNAGYNTGVGMYSLYGVTTGANNVAMGYEALKNNTTGAENTAVGANALDANTTASYNSAFGVGSLGTNTTGAKNTAFGHSSLFANTEGTENVAVGEVALDANTTGSFNTAIGRHALSSNTTASNNTAVGRNALGDSTTASYNTAIGMNCGDNITTASFCTLVGMSIDTGNAVDHNANALGYELTATGGYTTLGVATSDIRAAHGNTTWSTVSDKRVKKDITDAEAGLSFINDLRPRTFKYKAKGDLPEEFDAYEEGSTETYKNEFTNHGFIAQEVKEAVDNHPELKDGFKMWDVREHSGQQEVGEAAVIPILVKAVQELSTTVDELKAEIITLKGE